MTRDGDGKQLLSIRDLTVEYGSSRIPTVAVRNVSLDVPQGNAVALVGESGSGKSTIARSVLRVIDPSVGEIVQGKIWLDTTELLGLNPRRMRAVLRNQIGYIPQDPHAALDPLFTIGRQIAEHLDGRTPRKDRQEAIAGLLESLGVQNARERLESYPHEFSGGMKQRVAIATALACNPELLVADEPTTALDVTTQLSILRLIDRLRQERNLSLLFITHDLAVARVLCQEVVVLYAGVVMEMGPIGVVMQRPLHPYTQALVNSMPSKPTEVEARERLPTIPAARSDSDESHGCPFAPRCELSEARCWVSMPDMRRIGGVDVACWAVDAVDSTP